MQTKKNTKKTNARKIWIPILVILILAAAGGGYWYWNQTQLTAAAARVASGANVLRTAQVRTGSITLSATGTGVLAASRQTSLSFSASGNVAALNVQVGDKVTQGQVLAQLDNIDQLKTSVNVAQQNLNTAQIALDTLKQNSASNLGNAQLAVANAQKAVTDAKSAQVQAGMARCPQQEIDQDYQNYMMAQDELNKLTGTGNTSQDYYLYTIVPAKDKVAQAYATYVWCNGFTSYEIASSGANVTIAQAQATSAQTTLNTLQQNNGVDPTALAQAQNTVANDQLALAKANQTLTGATLTAPYDGTVLSVSGQVGDPAGTAAFITIADLDHPQVQFSIDEADMAQVVLNENATISFDALPNQTFTGKVVQINPSLQTVANYKVLQGLIQLDLSSVQNKPTLAAGMTTTVEIVSGQASNVLLVPIQALRDLGNGTYGVFVVTNGQPRLAVVTVGLMDSANAEIKTGLKAGQTVTTGVSQVKSSSGSSSNNSTGGGAGGPAGGGGPVGGGG